MKNKKTKINTRPSTRKPTKTHKLKKHTMKRKIKKAKRLSFAGIFSLAVVGILAVSNKVRDLFTFKRKKDYIDGEIVKDDKKDESNNSDK